MLPITARPIPDCPDYHADVDGSVWSTKRKAPRKILMTPSSNARAQYYRWRAKDNSGKYRNRKAHIEVLTVFVCPRPSPAHQARHLNGNSLDNRVENLAWGSVKDNAADRGGHGRDNFRPGRENIRPTAKLTEQQARHVYALRGVMRGPRVAAAYGITVEQVYKIWARDSWAWIHETTD